MHRVKGLEFRAVAIPALRDTLFPNQRARELEEPESDWHARERQLLFVACTRARDQLLLTCAGVLSPLVSIPANKSGFRHDAS